MSILLDSEQQRDDSKQRKRQLWFPHATKIPSRTQIGDAVVHGRHLEGLDQVYLL